MFLCGLGERDLRGPAPRRSMPGCGSSGRWRGPDWATRLGPVEAVDVWHALRQVRCQLAEQVESLEPERWDAASWCPGWRVRDVLGHLVHLAEATQLSMLADLVRGGGRPDRALSLAARRLGGDPVPGLAGRLRKAADGRFHVIGTPPPVALGEVLVHGADMLRPLGLDVDAPTAYAAAVLDVYRRVGRMVFHAAPHRRVRLVATDLDWARGHGPEVRGRAFDLLLLLANRRQVVELLDGPGVATL